MLTEVAADGGGLKEALGRGAFCELGTGDSGVADVLRELVIGGYDGWIVVEQDRALTPGTTTDDLRASQARNLAFLAELDLRAGDHVRS